MQQDTSKIQCRSMHITGLYWTFWVPVHSPRRLIFCPSVCSYVGLCSSMGGPGPAAVHARGKEYEDKANHRYVSLCLSIRGSMLVRARSGRKFGSARKRTLHPGSASGGHRPTHSRTTSHPAYTQMFLIQNLSLMEDLNNSNILE